MAISFDGLLARIGEAAIHAQRMASTAGHQRWEDMCDKQEDGSYTPKTMAINIGENTIKVPELSLAHPSVMPLEELVVQFEAQVDLNAIREHGRSDADIPSPEITVTPKRGLFNRATHFNVKANLPAH